MSERKYWLDLFTGTTWREFLDAGASVSGFRDRRRRIVKQIMPGDYLICYLTGVSRFIAVLEVVSHPYQDNSSTIWKDQEFPWRMKVDPVITLEPETAIPVQELSDRLSMFQNLTTPHAWTGHFRGSPAEWSETDARVVIDALQFAQREPVHRPFDQRKLDRTPVKLKSKMGMVTIPGHEESEHQAAESETIVEPRRHTEIQYLLLRLGADMGFDVWAARNDRGQQFQGKSFTDHFSLRSELPRQFDEATNRTIELIDVLWLKGTAIVAAFEVESTTSIYSGLLRMSDLIAMQPNLNIPLFLVAPDERRGKVGSEINRPTFSKLSPPMAKVCRYIPFSTLEKRYREVQSFVRYLKADFLNELAEDCATD